VRRNGFPSLHDGPNARCVLFILGGPPGTSPWLRAGLPAASLRPGGPCLTGRPRGFRHDGHRSQLSKVGRLLREERRSPISAHEDPPVVAYSVSTDHPVQCACCRNDLWQRFPRSEAINPGRSEPARGEWRAQPGWPLALPRDCARRLAALVRLVRQAPQRHPPGSSTTVASGGQCWPCSTPHPRCSCHPCMRPRAGRRVPGVLGHLGAAAPSVQMSS